MRIEVCRAFDFVQSESGSDSYTVLLDRAWPTRVHKDELNIDEWARSLAPPRALHDNLRNGNMPWPEFKAAYWDYLQQQRDQVDELTGKAGGHSLVLLHGWKDSRQNPAMALRDFLLMQRH